LLGFFVPTDHKIFSVIRRHIAAEQGALGKRIFIANLTADQVALNDLL
jgi:hypothetical protein